MRPVDVTTALASEVLAIAREAGTAIMRIYSGMLGSLEAAKATLVAIKADDSPLTQADLLSHQIITQRLKALTPELPVVSEEDGESLECRSPHGDFWLIDPLDGTKEFLANNGEFTVNIALIRDGKAILGVVTAPALGQAYWGGENLGAFREAGHGLESIRIANPVAVDCPLRIVASKSHLNSESRAFIGRMGSHELIQAGSSLKFCRVAEGAADAYPRLGPTCEWDTAAAQAVVEAAGGHVSALDGSPLRYGKPSVLNPYFVASSTPLSDLLERR